MPLLPGLISAVISNDPYPTRFEAFVVDLLSAEDGHTYLSTSRNYDQGRDARSLRGTQASQDVIAATTSRSLEDKTLDDVTKLLSTTQLASLTYCCSQEMTENALDGIGRAIRRILPQNVQLRLLALPQLRDLALRHEAILERHYSRELADLRTFLATPASDETPSDVGLRLALQTQVGDDALALRQEVCARLLLEQLLDGKWRTINDLVSSLSGRLHLPRAIQTGFLQPVLDDLLERQLLDVREEKYGLNDSGREFLAKRGEEAANRLFEGKHAVREALNELLGHPIPEAEYERLWPVFRDDVAELFQLHGAAIIEMVSSLQANSTVLDDSQFRAARERVADRVSLLFHNAEQKAEIHQAIIDLFSRRGTRAFEWLSSVCVVYVMMCSLGIESRSALEIGRILQAMTLLPDTDILLSLLCEGEDKHREIRRVLNGWRLLGGTVSAAIPVLEEVAYHAWAADHEFAESRDILGKVTNERAEYLVANAFVRTFRQIAPDSLSLPLWNRYILEFQGRSKYDYSKIVEILRHDFSIEPISGVSEGDATADQAYAPIRRFLLEQAARETGSSTDDLDDVAQDKARRDAILLTQVALLRQRLRQTASPTTMIIVSSARAIRRAGIEFKDQFDRPDAVITISAVATLLALTPGVGMGVQSLKALLFDTRLAKRLSPLERFAYRIVEQSGQYTLGISRRVSLRRRLREELIAQAQKTGRHPRQEELKLMSGADPEAATRILGGALRSMAITSGSEATIEAQQRRIQELEHEIARLRAQR